jgi:alkaline phosphatase
VAAPSVRTRVARAAVSAGMAVAVGACGVPADAPAAGAREEVARNVILFLGDGLGQKQHDFLQLALAGPTGELAMDRLGVTGSMDPSPAAYDQVTDSAAAATTIATGMPTSAGRIGVDDDGEPLPTLLERARDAGKATGLVTTAEVTDATPAAFAAHIDPTRALITETPEEAGERPNDEDDAEGVVGRAIARQYLERSRVDVILGGGAQRWSGLVEPARALGYATVSDAATLRAASADRVLGLFGDGPMFVPGGRLEGRYAPAVPLPDMTRAALEALDRREAGFFLVVAEEGIDAMARRGDGALVLEAGRALDRAVQVAMEFRAGNPDTLIVVVGSHETGGMDLTLSEPGAAPAGADGPFPATDSDGELWLRWTSEGPTDELTPITAGGPGAEAFEGDILITQLFPGLLEAMSVRA